MSLAELDAEQSLRANGLINMSEPNIEQKEGYFDLYIGQIIEGDSYSDNNIVLNAISELGYPLIYKNPKVDEESGLTYINAHATSEEQWRDVRDLDYLINVSGTGTLIHNVSDGNPHRLGMLLRGEVEEYYHYTPQSVNGMYPDGRFDADSQLLKRFYLATYDRYFQLIKEGRMFFELDSKRGYGPFTATPDSSDTVLYNDLIAEGIKPISPEELMQLAKEEGEKIKKEGIDKRMSLMEFRRQRPTSDNIPKV